MALARPLVPTCVQAIPEVKDEIRARVFGSRGVIDTDYFGRVFIRGEEVFEGGDVGNLYTTGAQANILEFHRFIAEGKVDNSTVAPSVRSNLTAILGPEAGTPGEKNSESQLKRLQEVQAAYQVTVLPILITKKEDLSHILPEVIRTSDAIYLTGSNLVDSEVSMIVAMATRGSVITVTHLEDLVEKGVLLGVCSDSYLSGRLAGEKGIKILKGATVIDPHRGPEKFSGDPEHEDGCGRAI